MTLDDYRIKCRWSKAEMARQARIDIATLGRAMRGTPVSLDTARKLASAISEELVVSLLSVGTRRNKHNSQKLPDRPNMISEGSRHCW